MDDFRRYPKGSSRQLIDYNRFLSLTGEKLFLCLDRGILEICRYFINSRGRWRTTYYVSNDFDGYFLPTEEQFVTLEHAIAEANIDMSSCDDIVTALNNIASQITASSGCGSCGGGSRGAGATEQEPNPYDQSETPGTPPPGFSTFGAFDSHKCNAAQDIVNALIQDLQGITGLDYIGSTIPLLIEAAIAVLFTPIPYDDLVFLISLLLFTVIEYTFLVQMSDEVFNNNDTLVCILYNSDTAEQAQVDFRTQLHAIIDDRPWIDAEKDFVKDAIDHMTPTDAMNRMFTNQPTVAQEADCSICEDALIFPSTFGGCTPLLVAGTPAGPTVTFQSCVANVFGSDRDQMVLATTEPGVERVWSNFSLVSGSDGTFVFDRVDGDGTVHSFNLTSFSEMPSTFNAASMRIVRGAPLLSTMQVEFDIAAI